MKPITLETIEALAGLASTQAIRIRNTTHHLRKPSYIDDTEAEDSLELEMFRLTLVMSKLNEIFSSELIKAD